MTEPSNNLWRIAGALGVPVDPTQGGGQEEVMTQGLGFPLRPIANVPPPDFDDVTDQVAEGVFMQFHTEGWEQGKFYTAGSTLTNGIFTMVANKLTLADPFPVPDGNPTFTLPAFAPSAEVNTSVIYSGHTWTFTENVLIKSFRVWVPTLSLNSHYRMIVVTTFPGASPQTEVIEEPVLAAGEWTVIALLNRLVPAGTTVLAFVDAYESNVGVPLVSPWDRNSDGATAPTTGGYMTTADRLQFRIDKTDSNGVDREAGLATIGINASIIITEQDQSSRNESFITNSVAQDMGTYFLWDVSKTGQGAGGQPRANRLSTVVLDTPTVIATGYAEELAGLADPAWATVVPFLEFDGVDQSPASDTAFGIDVEAEITVFSPDWDVFSFNG